MPIKRDPDRELKVFISGRDSTCGECGDELGHGAWITLAGEKGALCLACSDLDHLVYLPSGSAALTRRARAGARLSAVVLKWSRARKRYERQGLLVEETALAAAEEACLADADRRAQRQQRERERRDALDAEFVDAFARRIRELYPKCPDGRDRVIAEHACLKHSGRVGRTAAARAFDETAVRLAVQAHLRHAETNYDELLARLLDRGEARAQVADAVRDLLGRWSS
jgi:hypothetical protein